MGDGSDIPLTWGAQLDRAIRLLTVAGSPAPEQEAAELLSHVLGTPAPMLAAQRSAVMRQADAETYASWIARRAGGVPLPYITGHLEFMGLDITVGWDSPLPSPGAPRLVEAALQWARRHASGDLSGADVGTGCGAVALALAALEPRFTRIYAVDASPETLATAQANGARYLLNLVINWLDGRSLNAIPEPVDLIVCSQLDAPTRSLELLAQASTKLRLDGALLCAVTEAQRPAATAALLRGEPSALIWTESAGSHEPAIALAQYASNAAGNTTA